MKLPRWRLLNLLFNQRDRLYPDSAAMMVDRAEADPDDLRALADDGLIRFRDRATNQFLAALPTTAGVDLTQLVIHISLAGVEWVRDDPYNTVMRAVGFRDNAPLLHHVMTRCDLDLDAIITCAHAGLLTVINETTGQAITTPGRDVLTDALHRRGLICTLTPTRRGEWVMGR
jgi:hypothetical protein